MCFGLVVLSGEQLTYYIIEQSGRRAIAYHMLKVRTSIVVFKMCALMKHDGLPDAVIKIWQAISSSYYRHEEKQIIRVFIGKLRGSGHKYFGSFSAVLDQYGTFG